MYYQHPRDMDQWHSATKQLNTLSRHDPSTMACKTMREKLPSPWKFVAIPSLLCQVAQSVLRACKPSVLYHLAVIRPLVSAILGL